MVAELDELGGFQMNSMHACWYEKCGPARDVLHVGSLDIPQPGAGEVLVRMHVSGVNPTDIKRRSGARGELPFPRIIPGFDGAGIIEDVGAEVSKDRNGERVWVWEAAHQTAAGSAADYVAVPESRAMYLPASVSFADGASLGVPALTACRGMMLGGNLAGQVVIVTGGAGAVGNYAIQIAKHFGATVIATARDAVKAEDARLAGADHICSSDPADLAELALDVTGGKGVRHMLDVDLGAHLGDAWRYVAVNGSIASYGTQSDPAPVFPFAQYMYRNIAVHGVAIFSIPEAAKLSTGNIVQKALEAGELFHRVDRVFPLAEIAAAHERQESGQVRGKILIDLAP